MRRTVLIVAIVGAAAAMPTAQNATARFDVASIKTNTSGLNQMSMSTLPGGRFVARGVPLRDLIGYAYGDTDPFLPLPNNRIISSPAWAEAERFDIDAVVGTDGTSPELSNVLQMLRTLLTERFHMVAHHERRELPVYVLTVTRTDGALGPQLRRSDRGCSVPPAKRTGAASCGMQRRRGSIEARGMTVDSILLHGLNANLDRVVINNTGLMGEFDWTLEWGAETRPDSDDAGVQVGPPGPSIFTAMQEQLGLKLEPSRGPVDVLVIDSVERPTPN